MEIEAPSVGMSTISAPTISAPTFSGPSMEGGFSPVSRPEVGGLNLPGGEVGTPAAFQLAFDFGSEHQISREIFSADKAVSQPETVLNESFFETLVKVDNPSPTQVNRSNNGLNIQTSPLEEFFGPKLGLVEESKVEGQVSPEDFGFHVGQENRLEETDAGGEIAGKEVKIKRKNPFQNQLNIGNATYQEKSAWQIILGEPVFSPLSQEKMEKGEAEEKNEVAVEMETKVLIQTDTSNNNGRDGKTAVAIEKMSPEEPKTPKEPLWELSAKKETQEEVAKRVLKRRINVAREIIEESAKEMVEEGNADSYWLTSKVVTRLGKVDTPSFTEAVRMVFGNLIFPLVAGKAKEEIFRLKLNEITPGGIFKSLQETLIKNPPLKPKVAKMEKEGSLPESKLEKVGQEVAVLAQEGAEHIIYEPQAGKWISAPKKPFQYPWELDKTRKTVPVKNSSIDRDISPWYTAVAERAEARATRRNAKTQ